MKISMTRCVRPKYHISLQLLRVRVRVPSVSMRSDIFLRLELAEDPAN